MVAIFGLSLFLVFGAIMAVVAWRDDQRKIHQKHA